MTTTTGREAAGRLLERLRPAGLDALVLLSPENVAYAAGFVVPSQPLMRWRHAAVVLTAEGERAMLCVDMEETTVREAAPGVELRVWEEFGGDAMGTLAKLLDDLGLAGGRVGVELSYLPTADYWQLSAALSGTEIVAADAVIDEARMVKTPEEIALLARLARIADEAILAAFADARVGSTERDLAGRLAEEVLRRGADQFRLMIVATGERSELPNVGPTARRLVPGDVCRLEIFPVLSGYHAGVCRTAVVEKPSAPAGDVYARLVACRRALLEALRPGLAASRAYALVADALREVGLPPIAFAGHGIGVNLHERPYLAASSADVLEAGMVLGIEPLVYRTGHGFGMQIKDMVEITEDGCRVLSDAADADELLVVGA